MTRTVEVLMPKYPTLAKFAGYLYEQTQNPSMRPEQRKEAEAALKDIRLLAQEAGLFLQRQRAS